MLILSELGKGGMGVVYAAFDPELDRKVAIKMIRPDRDDGAEGASRLLREAQALAKLSHPNVVAIHDVGTHDDEVWIAMEFVQGRTVDAWLAERARSWREVLGIFKQAIQGVEAAHQVGFLHRDLKPANIMVGDDGRVRVMDFGLVCSKRSVEDQDLGAPFGDAVGYPLTKSGAMMGTAAYMAPEQFLNFPVDERTDQFALCVSLWECLYRERPFREGSLAIRAGDALQGRRLPPPPGARVPQWLHRVVERGLAPLPEERFARLTALRQALDADPTPRRRALGGVAILALATLTWMGTNHAQREGAVAACEAAGATIDAIWNPTAKAALRDGLVATGASYASTTAENIGPWLDAYAQAWRRGRIEACKAETVDGVWEPEIARRADTCLNQRRHFLDLLVRVGMSPGAGERAERVLEDFVHEAARLPSIEVCTDVDYLQRIPSLPRSTAARVEVLGLENLLLECRALMIGGASAEVLAHADVILNGAERLGWTPLVSGARTMRGKHFRFHGEYDRAAREFEAAYLTAGAAGDDASAAEAAFEIAGVVGRHQEHYADGVLWTRISEMGLDRAHVSATDPRRSSTLGLRGWLQSLQRDHEGAIGSVEEALKIAETAQGRRHPDTAALLHRLGMVLRSAKADDRARLRLEEAFQVFEETLGADHPKTVTTLISLGTIYASQGASGQAIGVLEQARSILEVAAGSRRDLYSVVTSLGMTKLALNDYAGAADALARAHALAEELHGPDHPETGKSLSRLSWLYQTQGELDRAAELQVRAITIQESAQGMEHPDLAEPLRTLSVIYRKQGKYADALAALKRALSIAEKGSDATRSSVAHILYTMGVVYAMMKQPEAALESFERALSIYRAFESPDELSIARTLDGMANVLAQRGDLTRAIKMAEDALEILLRRLGGDHPDVIRATKNLGEKWLTSGHPERAVPYLETAEEYLERKGGDPIELVDARYHLSRALWSSTAERERARALATGAWETIQASGDRGRLFLADNPEAESWLKRRSGGSARSPASAM